MKKNIVNCRMLYFFTLGLWYNIECRAYQESEYVQQICTDALSNFTQWYHANRIVVHSVAALSIAYLLYKNYCPVAHRCEKCLENNELEK